MTYRVYRLTPTGDVEKLREDHVQGWEPPPAVGEDWPHCGEIIAVSPERVEVDWSGEGKFTLVRDIIVK